MHRRNILWGVLSAIGGAVLSVLGLSVGPILLAWGRGRAMPSAAMEGLTLGLVPAEAGETRVTRRSVVPMPRICRSKAASVLETDC